MINPSWPATRAVVTWLRLAEADPQQTILLTTRDLREALGLPDPEGLDRDDPTPVVVNIELEELG